MGRADRGESLARVVILVEGRSDAAVVQTLVRSRGLVRTGDAVRVIPMGGVTNIRAHFQAARRDTDAVLGLYDAPEERFVLGGLRAAGHGVGPAAGHRDDVVRLGFFACHRDLEDELIRSLGAPAVEAALRELGELDRFRTFQRQPEWRGRALRDQLHRFAGSGSGRKLALAGRLAAALTPETTPPPLAQLLARLASLVPATPDDPVCR